jgi:hypothetical protein
MKHFTYDLIAAANDWIEQSDGARLEAERQFALVQRQYRDSLREIKPRISRAAWNFFDSGHGHSGQPGPNLRKTLLRPGNRIPVSSRNLV